MSVDARGGLAAFLLAGLLGATPACAETAGSGSWVDPPVRGAAGPSVTPPAKNEAEAPAPIKPSENAAAPAKVVPPETTAEAGRATRSAGSRRKQIRAAAAQSRHPATRAFAYAEPAYRAPRQASLATHPVARPSIRAQRVYAQRYRYASRDEAFTPYRSRRAGWGGLIEDTRARRISDAQAAGYIVMRARTYAYPDGMLVRSYRPYDPDDLD